VGNHEQTETFEPLPASGRTYCL